MSESWKSKLPCVLCVAGSILFLVVVILLGLSIVSIVENQEIWGIVFLVAAVLVLLGCVGCLVLRVVFDKPYKDYIDRPTW
jgi:ABC-type transport system involved in multi-copper enzyme maturation permease subunit